MEILLDTQVFLWLCIDSSSLSSKAKKLFLAKENDFYLSIASIWEMAIKVSIGKLKLPQSVNGFVLNQLQQNSISILNIEFRHVASIENFPFHHRDPFDRLLISQALEEKIPILSSDTIFDSYQVKRLW